MSINNLFVRPGVLDSFGLTDPLNNPKKGPLFHLITLRDETLHVVSTVLRQ